MQHSYYPSTAPGLILTGAVPKSGVTLQDSGVHELDFTQLLNQSRELAGNRPASANKHHSAVPEDCTFHPQIRASSHARTPRSVYELSIGDQQRKEAWIEAQQQLQEEAKAAEHPFKPDVLPVPRQYRQVQSKLSISHPAFLDHWNRKREMMDTLAMHKQYAREVRLLCAHPHAFPALPP